MQKTATEFGQFGRVILTYGRSLMSLVAAQSLARRGIEVIGCDSVDMTVLRFSKYCTKYHVHPDPYDDDEDAYIKGIIDIVEENRPGEAKPYILMPMFDNARILAKRISELPDYVTLAAASWESIGTVYPKDRLVRTMEKHPGLSPKSAIVNNAAEIAGVLQRLELPLVIKPAVGVGGRGVVFVETREQLTEAYTDGSRDFDGPQIVQETAAGEDYCMTLIAKDGDIIAAMAYKNLETFPKKSGAGTLRVTVGHEPFMNAASAIMSEAKWNGVAEIDYRWNGDPETAPQLIEVNARFWAGLYHSIASGLDYPWLLYQLAAYGEVSEKPEVVIGTTTKTPVLSHFSMVSSILSRSFRINAGKRMIKRGWRHLVHGEWNGLAMIWRGFRGSVKFDKGAFAAMEQMEASKGAPSEFDNAHDPYAGLGVLFILSSLLRHGRLPDEVKF